MASISSIPKRYIEGFKLLSSIDDNIFRSIIDGFKYTSLTSSIRGLARKIATDKSLEADIVEPIFVSVASLTAVLEKSNSTEDVVNDICSIVVNKKLFDLSTNENKEKFKSRLLALLKVQQLYYAAKAGDLITENENLYIQSRIITDIRPIFSAEIEESPKAGMIIHNLHIHYQVGVTAEHKDIFLALNLDDISELQNMLTRAIKKEKSLQFVFDKTNMTNLND